MWGHWTNAVVCGMGAIRGLRYGAGSWCGIKVVPWRGSMRVVPWGGPCGILKE